MKIVFAEVPEVRKRFIKDLPYGGCCLLPTRPESEVFMRLQTTHKKVQIRKTDANDNGINLIKLLNLSTHEIECHPFSTECEPVTTTLYVDREKK